jgi:hypothetical protein
VFKKIKETQRKTIRHILVWKRKMINQEYKKMANESEDKARRVP